MMPKLFFELSSCPATVKFAKSLLESLFHGNQVYECQVEAAREPTGLEEHQDKPCKSWARGVHGSSFGTGYF
jgi:hypothetical protein